MSFRMKVVGLGDNPTVTPPDVYPVSPPSFGILEVTIGSDGSGNPAFENGTYGSKSGTEPLPANQLVELSTDGTGLYVMFAGDPTIKPGSSFLFDGDVAVRIDSADVMAYSESSNAYTLYWTTAPYQLEANSTVEFTIVDVEE